MNTPNVLTLGKQYISSSYIRSIVDDLIPQRKYSSCGRSVYRKHMKERYKYRLLCLRYNIFHVV